MEKASGIKRERENESGDQKDVEPAEKKSLHEKVSIEDILKVTEGEIEAKSTDTANDFCIVCMENSGGDKTFMPVHGCSQCSPKAWRICVCCNESFLSRSCPVCRGDYAPLVMYKVPGTPIMKLGDKSLKDEDRSMLLYKFGIIRHLIGKSNVGVWNPSTGRMYFSLPREFTADSKDSNCLLVNIPMTQDRIQNDNFIFNNKIWDEIEKEMEQSDNDNVLTELKPSKFAIQWLLSFTKEEGSEIFAMMTPQDWQYMLDPSASNDTKEALKAIQDNVVINQNSN